MIIIWKNSINFNIYYSLSTILPFSIDRVNYLHEWDHEDKNMKFDLNVHLRWLNIINKNEIIDFFDFLGYNNYILTMEYIPNVKKYNSDVPQLFIAKPILINRYSSPTLIYKFIEERLDYTTNYFALNKKLTGGILCHYTEITDL
nr:hypothetical protein [Russula griseocarnosa]